MIGCHAEALSRDIVVDHGELDDARWFTREDASLMLARRHPENFTATVPMAIAYHIIRAWVEDRVGFT
jgi:NAD+ diphosphatase